VILAIRSPEAASVDLIAVFQERCWARARLFAEGELELADAVDELQNSAVGNGLVAAIGQDAVQTMMSEAFSAVRKKSTAWDAPEDLSSDLALISEGIDRWATTVEMLRYLVSLGDPVHLRRWLTGHRSEIDALEQLLVVT
jgi:hypothetical protein